MLFLGLTGLLTVLLDCDKSGSNSGFDNLPDLTNYPIVDTDKKVSFNNISEMSAPSLGASFYGQDASYYGNAPSYTDNGDGTITDNVTEFIWQKGYKKMTYPEPLEAEE